MNTRENYSDFSFNPGELSNFDMAENGRFPQFLYKTTLSEGRLVVQKILYGNSFWGGFVFADSKDFLDGIENKN